jgi:hypothetical protein
MKAEKSFGYVSEEDADFSFTCTDVAYYDLYSAF